MGVLQSFEFPTVYTRQKQVAKAETALAQTGQAVNENELRYTVRTLYLEAQVAEYQARQWAERDSVYIQLAGTAARQFSGGEIDFLQKTLADNQAGIVHQERLAAEQNVYLFRQQLQSLTTIADLSVLSPLEADTVGLFGQTLQGNFTGNPSIAYEQQTARVAEQQIRLAKSRALPNFSLGYLIGRPDFSREASQALGQKNTTFTIYLALTYANPLVALGPTCYVLWHNLWNSWQLQRASRQPPR